MTFVRKTSLLAFALTVATLALVQDSLSLLSGVWRMTSLEDGYNEQNSGAAVQQKGRAHTGSWLDERRYVCAG